MSVTGRNEVNKALKSVQSALINYKITVSSQSVQDILDPYPKEERADVLNFWWCPEKCAVKLNNAKLNIKES